jgi:stage II sporulation protein P
VLFIIIPFIIISTLTSVLSTRLSSEYIGNILRNVQSTELYLTIIQSQNHYMTGKDVEVPKLPIMEFSFELATNLKPYDIRSFLGKEIPGFYAYDTQFYEAGRGTDYTDNPFESVAPMEVLLKEREIAEEMLLADEKEDEPTPAPEKSMDETIVHIYQSHSWESYLPLLRDVSEPDDATSNNPEANVIAVGKMLKNELADKGIKANHDTRNVPKDLAARGWNYNHSYQYSRETIEAAMMFNSDVKYLIDIHRDAARRPRRSSPHA